MNNIHEIRVTVYIDAVRAEIENLGFVRNLGWFRDEVEAVSAGAERAMLESAILPSLRQLPMLNVRCDYRKVKSGHVPDKFHRATISKTGQGERRVVMLPGSMAKSWVPNHATFGL